jgi:hypothetical protein
VREAVFFRRPPEPGAERLHERFSLRDASSPQSAGAAQVLKTLAI